MKGGDWVPEDSIYARITKESTYDLVKLAHDGTIICSVYGEVVFIQVTLFMTLVMSLAFWYGRTSCSRVGTIRILILNFMRKLAAKWNASLENTEITPLLDCGAGTNETCKCLVKCRSK